MAVVGQVKDGTPMLPAGEHVVPNAGTSQSVWHGPGTEAAEDDWVLGTPD